MSHPSHAPDGSFPPSGGSDPVTQPMPIGGEQGYALPDPGYPAPPPYSASPAVPPAPAAPAAPAGPDQGYGPGGARVSSGAPHPALVTPTLAMPSAGYPPPQAPLGADAGVSASAPSFGAQPSAPSFGGQPSAPGVAGPVSGMPAQQPYPGAPMSGAPYGQPMGAAPMSGVPYGAPTPGAPGKGKTTIVLALVAVLLFVLGGVMTGLFVAKSSELTKAEQRLTAQDAKLDADAKEIDGLKRDVQVANDKVKQVEQDLTGTKNDRDEQARQKQVIGKCLDLLGKALSADDRATFEKLAKDADKACKEANKYL